MITRRSVIATITAGGTIGLAGCSTEIRNIGGSSENSSADSTQNIPTITGSSYIQLDEFLFLINTSIRNPQKEVSRRDLHIRIYDEQDNQLDEKTITAVIPPESEAAYPIRIAGDGYNPNDVSSNKIEGTLTKENGTPTEQSYENIGGNSLTEKTDLIKLSNSALGTDKNGDKNIETIRLSLAIPYDYTLRLAEVNFTFVTKGIATVVSGSESDIVQYRDYENTVPVLENRDKNVIPIFQLSEIDPLPQWGESQRGIMVAHHQDHGSSFILLETSSSIRKDDSNLL